MNAQIGHSSLFKIQVAQASDFAPVVADMATSYFTMEDGDASQGADSSVIHRPKEMAL